MSAASTPSSMTWGERCSKGISASALALEGAVTDVPAVVRSRPMHGVGERVGRAPRGGDARAQADGAQYAPPVGEHPAGVEPGAGVEDLAGQLRGALEPLDGVPLSYALGVARGRHHDAERRTRIPPRALAVEALLERGLAQRGEIGLEAHHDRLRLGIPQPAVELEHV